MKKTTNLKLKEKKKLQLEESRKKHELDLERIRNEEAQSFEQKRLEIEQEKEKLRAAMEMEKKLKLEEIDRLTKEKEERERLSEKERKKKMKKKNWKNWKEQNKKNKLDYFNLKKKKLQMQLTEKANASTKKDDYIKTHPEIHSWLNELSLAEYLANFISNGFDTIEVISMINETDLDNCQITLTGHRKKILHATNLLSSELNKKKYT